MLDQDWLTQLNFPIDYQNRIEKQLNFLMDIANDFHQVKAVQLRIMTSKIAIFGLGGVGSWIALELIMMGFTDFILFDQGIATESDAARHAFFDHTKIGLSKVDVVAEGMLAINPNLKITAINITLSIDTNLSEFLSEVDFIINAADDPYIGYTSIKLSRYAIYHNLPMFVAGGFDAHLASFGELIIPRVTPCADCFVRFFKKALIDWKPIAHPIKFRGGGFGGWSPLSVISASATTIQILKYFINPDDVAKGRRIEFLATDYSTYTFEVKRDKNCKICGDA